MGGEEEEREVAEASLVQSRTRPSRAEVTINTDGEADEDKETESVSSSWLGTISCTLMLVTSSSWQSTSLEKRVVLRSTVCRGKYPKFAHLASSLNSLFWAMNSHNLTPLPSAVAIQPPPPSEIAKGRRGSRPRRASSSRRPRTTLWSATSMEAASRRLRGS